MLAKSPSAPSTNPGISPQIELKGILENLSSLSRFQKAIEGNGGNFQEYLANRREELHLPEYMVRIREGNQESVLYFPDEKSLSTYAAENRDLKPLR